MTTEELTKLLRELADAAPVRKDPKKPFVHPLIKRLLNRIKDDNTRTN